MKTLVIGMGEIGSALHDLLKEKYGNKVRAYDIKEGKKELPKVDLLNICIPYSDEFTAIVNDYISECTPKYTIIHSSVPVGTTEQISGNAFHSPVRGKHPNMKEGLLSYVKYISFDGPNFYNATILVNYFSEVGIVCKSVPDTRSTELMKLLALSRYGVYIAFAKEQEKICEHYKLPYHKVVTDFEKTRTEGLHKLGRPELIQPLLWPFDNFIGGHCTVEDMQLLIDQYDEAPLLTLACSIGKNTKIWDKCNIYSTAKIGKGCNIAFGCEIGNKVVIGNNVRIGSMCFIPEGVTIEDDVFVAPKVTFSNDKYPPSSKECWGKILVKKGAVIGMGSVILPGVIIGENALIGAGSIVTKNVPAAEKWYGNPARQHGPLLEDTEEAKIVQKQKDVNHI